MGEVLECLYKELMEKNTPELIIEGIMEGFNNGKLNREGNKTNAEISNGY